MKIAYTISGIYNSGGMENILLQKANYLSDHFGHEITIITTDQGNKDVFFYISPKVKLYDLGINYYKSKKLKLWHIKKYFLKRKHKKLLERYLNQNQFDLVISLMDFDFSFLYKIKDGSKKIIEYHFSKYSKVYATNNLLKQIIQKFRADNWGTIAAKYDKFIVLTEEDKLLWGNIDNIMVIPNFIKEIPERRAELLNPRVITVGRADYQKGYDLLIDAWAIVNKKFPEWKLTIIGGGEKALLQNQIDNLNLSDSIRLLPPTSHIDKEYLKSSLYVMSSRYEGLPLVLLEAMSFGLPIVSFRCPCGPKDILKPSFSTLVDCNDVMSLAEGMKNWMKDETRRIIAGEFAKEESQKYSINMIMNKWDTLFKSL